MSKFRLKNRELQKALDSISNGDFTKQLETEAQIDIPPFDLCGVVRVYFGDFGGRLVDRYSVLFERDELEEVIEFDPTKWNEWPEVDPPAMKAMRIEADDGTGIKAFWDGGWRRYGSGELINCPSLKFRPWEDK